MMNAVAFIAAMELEIRPFLRRIGPHRRDRVGRFTRFRFELFGQECILIQTGVGIARATEAARALLSTRRPGLVVSFGIAGAPQEGLEIGDLVVARNVRLLKAGILGPVRSLASLSDGAYRAVKKALLPTGARVSHGSVITTWGEQPSASHGMRGMRMEAPVLEMETAGIAEVCAEKGIPLISLRAISDSVREPLPFALPDFLDDRQHLMIGKLGVAVLGRPTLLPALLRLSTNARRAADNAAAAALAAIMEQMRE